MFGYVRPVPDRLEDSGREAYQSAYCGLCHAMGRRHGFLARLTLQYDFTFLAILLTAAHGVEGAACRRCPVHPVRKPRLCLEGEALDAAADESVILTWHKLCDDVDDHGPLTGLPFRLARLLFRRAYRRAAAARPAFDAGVREGLARLRQLEQARSRSLDRTADAFASILAGAAQGCPDPRTRRPLEQLFYHLGRWIYLVDGWDDLDGDRRRGRYNPVDARFQGRAREEREYFEATLTHSARLAASAANLLELGRWRDVVDNVLYLGLPAVQSAVLDGRWKEMRKTRRHSHERSLSGTGRQS